MHCLLILPLICSYMRDLASTTHIWCISGFVLKIGYYIGLYKLLYKVEVLLNLGKNNLIDTKNKVCAFHLLTYTIPTLYLYKIIKS